MLSVFPQLLFLSPLGLALLRVVAGLFFLYIGWFYISKRSEVHEQKVPVWRHTPEWLLIVGGLILAVVGCCLVAGFWTQPAALIGAIAAAKCAIFAKKYPGAFPFSRATWLLLLVISLSLVVSGAGSFAFDLPL